MSVLTPKLEPTAVAAKPTRLLMVAWPIVVACWALLALWMAADARLTGVVGAAALLATEHVTVTTGTAMLDLVYP
jgi:hypothetical protein